VIASPSQDVSPEVVASAISPSGKLTAILRETNSAGDKKRFVEVWEGERLEASVNVSKAHGVFYTDGEPSSVAQSPRYLPPPPPKHTNKPETFFPLDQLSTLAFSPSESLLVYTAEANAPENEGDDSFAKFRFMPDYGEGYIGRKRPTIFIVRWVPNGDSVDALSGGNVSPTVRAVSVPSSATSNATDISFGQAQFVADDTLFATGYEYSEDGRRLGIMACFNRPTAIWELKFDPVELQLQHAADSEPSVLADPTAALTAISATKISDLSRASRSSRPIPSSNAALWFSHELGGPHASCFSLHRFNLHVRETTTIIPTVNKIQENFMDGFAGLYVGDLLARPFVRLGGRTYLLTRTSQGSRLEVILIDLEQPESVIRLTPAESSEDLWSWSPLATDGRKWVLASRSTPTVPNELALGKLEEVGGEPRVVWQVIEMPSLTPRGEYPGICWRIFFFLAFDSCALLMLGFSGEFSARAPGCRVPYRRSKPSRDDPDRTKATKGTAVTDRHTRWPPWSDSDSFCSGSGGICVTRMYDTPPAFANVANGPRIDTLNIPNYTGSTGFGDFYVQKLIGKCGTLDVEDVKATVDLLVREGKGEHGPGKQFVTGGSHGGFLTAHCKCDF
jgi:prolyl oligopeptidase family protein